MLKLSDIRKDLKLKISKGVQNYSIKELAENKYGIKLDYDVYLPSIGKNLQRDFCWSIEQKRELIMSVLKGIRLPSISVIVLNQELYKIIDGKQRLSTLISYYNNEFPISFEGNDYHFKDLDDPAKQQISLLTLTTDIAYEYSDTLISDETKIAWFEMINFAGTPQDIEHLNNLKSQK